MMLFKLSFNNIRKSFKDYAIYFFTLILGVAIFYVFNAIESQTVMLDVGTSTKEIIEIMTSMLSGVSVFVSFVLGFLIVYASRFLMKRRNKEFAIYMVLGMSKRKISAILLLETMLIGILSLIVGLGIGIFLSQFMSILVANMFEADLTRFTFTFSISAFKKTIGYFGVMYLIVMIFNTVSVSKCKLIDLLYAHKKSEKIKLKNRYLCVLLFVLSTIVLGLAYYIILGGIERISSVGGLFIPILMGCIATFFFFWSLSGLLLRIVQSKKNFYFKGLHSFTFREISSQINTNVMAMSLICIMLFLTICVLSSALSMKNSMNHNISTLAPADIQFKKRIELDDKTYRIEDTLDFLNIDYKRYLKDMTSLNFYTGDYTLQTTLGSAYESVKEKFPEDFFAFPEKFVSVSDYNETAKVLGLEEISLSSKEYALVADLASWEEIRNAGLKVNASITIEGEMLFPKYQECQNGFVYLSPNHMNFGFFVIPDELVKNLNRDEVVLTANYNAETDDDKKKIEELIFNADRGKVNTVGLYATSRMIIKEATVGLGAMVTFIGIYLGIIFLLASALILSLKELSESLDNRGRYQMLRKIGVEENMIHNSLFLSMAIFFGAPLLLAIVHSVFGVWFCCDLLEMFGSEQLLISILVTSSVIILIYGGYFFLTFYTSKYIIKNNQ